MVVRAGLGIWVVHVDSAPALLLGQQLLDLPVVHPSSNREFQIFLGDGVPVLQTSLLVKSLWHGAARGA